MPMLYSLSRFLYQIRRRRDLGIALLVVVLILSLIGNSVTFYLFDRGVQDISIWDSLWYSVISITTIGYGDLSAQSLGARIGTVVFIIIIGLVAFTTAIGVMVDRIVELRQKERRGMGSSRASDHLLIVNFPNESRIRQIIEEFTRDEEHEHREIIIVTDQIEELPFSINNVSFIRGSPLEQETFARANIADARQAIVLSTSADDPRTDSLVASISFVMEHMNVGMSIVAECQDPKHAVLFNVSGHVSLVYTTRVANNLLVQEAQDPGVNLLTETITSNVTEIEETVVSTKLDAVPETPVSYTDAAKRLIDHDVNLVGVIRQGALVVGFQGMSVSTDDSLVYISKRRHTPAELNGFIA
jgi:voltage-gated potassium channel